MPRLASPSFLKQMDSITVIKILIIWSKKGFEIYNLTQFKKSFLRKKCSILLDSKKIRLSYGKKKKKL